MPVTVPTQRGTRLVLAGVVAALLVTALGVGDQAMLTRQGNAAAVAPALAPGTPTPAPSPSSAAGSEPGGGAGPAVVTAAPAQPHRGTITSKGPTKLEVAVPSSGPGTYTYAHEDVPPASKRGTLKRYDVRIEKGLDIDADEAALSIEKVLNDKRSWRGTGRWRFELVSAGEAADLHIYIVTPGTTNRLCAPLLTRGEVSCQSGNRVILNAKRWLRGVKYYGDDVAGYRRYLVNHEVGHALGHQHVGCSGSGDLAPVMMQQTKGLGGCRKNPWPLPGGD